MGLDNIAKVVQELQAEDDYARMEGRQAESLDDVKRLEKYLKRQLNMEDEANPIEEWEEEWEDGALRLAHNRLQQHEQTMASILGLTESSL